MFGRLQANGPFIESIGFVINLGKYLCRGVVLGFVQYFTP